MRENTRPSIMQNFDTELAALISKSRGVSLMDGLRIFLKSQTHEMCIRDSLGALSERPAEAILEGNDIFVEFKGALTEQYVLQQMISDTPYTPYYYGTDKGTFEQDFLIQKERNIVPIEVKAEGNLRSQSLKAYCEKFHPNMAVRLSALKYKEQGWMINLPLYAVCTL